MNAVVICPDRRAQVTFLARKQPLALVPVLGPSVLSHCLSELADRGVKAVTLLASDRPDRVRQAVGGGERWGLRLEVRAEQREWSVAEARERFGTEHVVLADRLPALPAKPLFTSYGAFFAALQQWLPLARQHRVGAKEIAPGVWAGLRCKVDPTAKLLAPCWLGENVWVRSRASIGPNAVVEDGAVVDHDAEIAQSWIGPWTYVGALTHVNRSLAWADGLLNHASGSFTEVVDMFLLGDLRGDHGFVRSSPWYGRAAALVVALVSSPAVLVAAVKNRGSAEPLFVRRRAIIPTAVAGQTAWREMTYAELHGWSGLLRRWPQLWSIVRGDFTWVGNRPLRREQAAQLETEFEQLWLAAPVGLVSLADTFGCGDVFDDESRAHAGFYAVRADARLDRAVLGKVLRSFFRRPKPQDARKAT
jgi:hypothetical protein